LLPQAIKKKQRQKQRRNAMEDILTLIANFGFPIVVSAYLLVRIEGKLEKLTAAITDLAQVVGELKVGAMVDP
jgi:hypothetical protein